ncbi:MAG: methylmalonyl-CoA mutase [Deltaproteobacteria bacterium]|nr:methylmalonyl-CoA mutase [Deltaproteobacteria bacterium]
MPKTKSKEKTTVKTALRQWEEQVRRPSLDKMPETKKEFKTLSGNPVEPLYTPVHIEGLDYQRDIGFPGQFPFTRGRMPNGYRSFEWPHDFYAGYGSGESANDRYRDLINHGATVITIALDLPTQIGLDSDDLMAKGEVGKVGVALASRADIERSLEGIDLAKVGIGFVANSIAAYALSLILVLAEKRSINPAFLRRFKIQNDPIREYQGRGTYIFPVPMAVELSTDVVEYICRNFEDKWHEQWVPQYVCTGQMRSGGVTAAQEIGFGIANFLTYIDSALSRGLSLEQFVPKMELHAEADIDLFEEVSKFRAARRLWARIIKEKYNCEDPRVCGLRITTYAAIRRMTAQQPLNNLARITMEVLAAILGGIEHTWAPAFDEALALPTSESTRVANQVKFILHHECGLQNVVDPMGGSYYVEKLTSQIEEEARHWVKEVEQRGGVIPAIEKGYIFAQEMEGLYKYQKWIESGERKILGINFMQKDEEIPIDIFQVDPQNELRQVERLQRLRKERDNILVRQRLEELGEVTTKKATHPKTNIVPAVLEAVRAYATIGEIYGVFRKVFGEFKATAF